MIGFSFKRSPGGRRYSPSDRAEARASSARGLPPNLGPGFAASLTDPDGIRPVVDVAFELESNRLQRPTTTVLLRNAVNVGVLDATTMSTASLSSGKSNPTRVYAIADASAADVAYVFDLDPGGIEDLPVAFADPPPAGGAFLTVPNGNGQDGFVATGRGSFTTDIVGATITGSTSTADAGRLANDRPFVYVLTKTAAATGTIKLGEKATPYAQRYGIGSTGRKTYTVAVDVKAGGTDDLLLRLSVEATNAVGGAVYQPAAPDVLVPVSAAAGVMTRVVRQVTVVAPAGTTLSRVRPVLSLLNGGAGTGPTRVEFVDLQVYGGAERPAAGGRLAATPDSDYVVEQTWTAERNVNRVDISGEIRAGSVTAASVYTQTAVGGVWTLRETAEGSGGRLSIPIPLTSAYGVRVRVEETDGGEASPIFVTEVDPTYLVDVSDSVGDLVLEWSREADPGQASSPVGNYEASTLTLSLDDTAGAWNPATNAALDVGHRIEVAVGTRRTNQLRNPRADVDAVGPGAAWLRTMDLPAAAPSATAFVVTKTAISTKLAGGETVPYAGSAVGDLWRLSGWVYCDGPPDALGYLGLGVRSATLPVTTINPTGAVYAAPVPPGVWVYVARDFTTLTAPAAVQPIVKITSGTADPVAVFTSRLKLERFPSGYTVAAETVEELASAGVFYSEPFDTDSERATVTIEATDRLGRLSGVAVEEEVRVGQRVEQIVAEIALKYLDLDTDQLTIASSIGGVTIPYAFPTGDLGTYFADIAKATVSTLHVDDLERLTLAGRSDTTLAPVTEIRADNALRRYRRPPGYDVTTSVVTVTANPLTKRATSVELWAMPPGGVTIPASGNRVVIAEYSESPAVGGSTSGIVADGSYSITSATFATDKALLKIRNNETRTLVVADLRVVGYPLDPRPIAARAEHAPSVARYGPRELVVDAPLIQTQSQVDTVAVVLLDAFRAIDDAGVRRLPDLEVEALGLITVEAGDKVTISDPSGGVGDDYAVLGRQIAYSADGSLLANGVRLRQASGGLFLIVDVGIADDVFVAGY